MLEAAYNDSAGVTAEFNKNVLSVLNRELDADFDLDSFEHVAFWDPENLWIDIRLRSLANQVVNVPALDMLVPFGARRGDAHRDLDQVPRARARGHLRRGRPRADRLVDGPRGPLRPLARESRLTHELPVEAVRDVVRRLGARQLRQVSGVEHEHERAARARVEDD